MMKAWRASSINDDEYAAVVYADTATRAKAVVMSDPYYWDCEYIYIRVNRIKSMDDLYDHEYVMNWDKDADRLALVKEGWCCIDDFRDDCKVCIGKEYCSEWDSDL